jgi:hypothetical protein
VSRSHGMLALLAAAFVLSGCNVFSPFTSPSGDDQTLSAARAALDQGNYQEAITLYGQLSSSENDTAQSEIAYAMLEQAGASMEDYAAAFGKGTGSIGPAITTYAESLMPGSPTKRIAIWQAFNNQTKINNVQLNALVRFLGALSFAAEILAETGTNGTVTAADLNNGSVMISANRVPSSGSGLSLGGSLPGQTPVAGASLSDISGTPTYNMFNAAFVEVIQDIAELGDQGTFGASSLTFAQTVTNGFSATPAATSLYVSALVAVGIGTQQ